MEKEFVKSRCVIPKYAHKYLLSLGFSQVETRHDDVVEYRTNHKMPIVVKGASYIPPSEKQTHYKVLKIVNGKELLIADWYFVNNKRELQFLILSATKMKGCFHNKSSKNLLLNSLKRYSLSLLEFLNISPSCPSVCSKS